MALHGSSFCCKGNVFSMELTTMPRLGIKSFKKLAHLSSTFPKQSSYAVAEYSKRRQKFQLLPGCCHLDMRNGSSSKSFCLSFYTYGVCVFSKFYHNVDYITSSWCIYFPASFYNNIPILNTSNSIIFSAAILIQNSRLLSLRPCQVKGEDVEGSSSGESLILDLETLERDLNIAIAEENYAKAARIRDSLKLLQEDSNTAVLAANARFYDAFRCGDLARMQTLWAKGDEVCCVHPGPRGISGYDDVMTSWEYVWANYEFPLFIELKDIKVHVRGDMGYVNCVELVKTKGSSWGGQFVTNVFERIDGQWFISIHHASPIDL